VADFLAPDRPKSFGRQPAMGGAGAVFSTFRVALPTAYDGIERNRSPKYATASQWIPPHDTHKPDLREVIGSTPRELTQINHREVTSCLGNH
jgi:hypothetical protein